MNCSRATSTAILKQPAAILKTLNVAKVTPAVCQPAFVGLQQSGRHFHTTKPALIKEFFPQPDTPSIRKTEAAWKHPIYTQEQMNSIQIAHRETKNWSDYAALTMVRILRWGLDTASGYKHDQAVALGEKDPAAAHKKYAMTERKYLIRSASTF